MMLNKQLDFNEAFSASWLWVVGRAKRLKHTNLIKTPQAFNGSDTVELSILLI